MDIVTMAMAKPKKVNLSNISVTYNGESVTLNDVVNGVAVILMTTAYTNGTAVEYVEVDAASAFWAAVNTKRPINLICNIAGNEFESTAAVIRLGNDVAQIMTITTFNANGTVIDSAFTFQANNSDDGHLGILVKMAGTPV
jgi:hypothetical protein